MGNPETRDRADTSKSTLRILLWVLAAVIALTLLRPFLYDEETGVHLVHKGTYERLEVEADFSNGLLRQWNPELITQAMDAGLDLNATMLTNWTPLRLYVNNAPDNEEGVALLREMIARGLDASAEGDIVAYAIQYRKTQLARVLLEHGARVDGIWESPTHTMNSRSALMFAVESKNAEAIELLLSFGADPYQRTSRGISAMDLAEGDLGERLKKAYAERAASSPASPNATVGEGMTPLVVAIQSGDVEAARQLLDDGADPNLDAPGGLNPLVEAARSGEPRLVELLLLRGADPYRLTPMGETPLHAVAKLESEHATTALRRLLATPGNVDVLDTIERTPLYGALDSRQWDNAHLLVAHGADPLERGKWGMPLVQGVGEWDRVGTLMLFMMDSVGKWRLPQKELTEWLYSMTVQNRDISERQFFTLLDEMTKRGFDFSEGLEETTKNGRSVPAEQILLAAVERNWLQTVRLLGEIGVIRRERLLESQLRKALETAARAENTHILRAMLDNGDPAEAAALANMAVYGAIEGNNRETLLMLVQFGADSSGVPLTGRSALGLAETMERADASDLLALQGAKSNAPDGAGCTLDTSPSRDTRVEQLVLAVRQPDLDCARALIEQGAPINWHDRLGWTPLHHAASRADVGMARMLVEKGAETKRFKLPITHVVGTEAEPSADLVEREVEMLELLFENGASTLAQDEQRRSILHIALIREKPEWFKAMQGRRGSWLTPDDSGLTPNMYLREQASAEFLLGLLEEPGLRWREDKDFVSSVMPRAVETRSLGLLQLLLDAGAEAYYERDKQNAVTLLLGLDSSRRPRDWENERLVRATAFAAQLEQDPVLAAMYAELIKEYGILDPYPLKDVHAPDFQEAVMRSLSDPAVYAPLVAAASRKAPRWVYAMIEAGHPAADNGLLYEHLLQNSRMTHETFLGKLAHGAVVLGHAHLLTYLLQEQGLDPNLRDGEGRTLLDLAEHWDRSSVVDVLLLHGALRGDARSTDSGGEKHEYSN